VGRRNNVIEGVDEMRRDEMSVDEEEDVYLHYLPTYLIDHLHHLHCLPTCLPTCPPTCLREEKMD
jgi:hypothetical protein